MSDLPVDVRPEVEADHAAVEEVVERAFGQPDEARIVRAAREACDPELSLVAVVDERVVGHVLFSPVTVTQEGESGDRASFGALGLAPLAVAPELQRKGIGGTLVRAGLEACRRRGHGVVVVLGHPEYYPRFGFEVAVEKGLVLDLPVPPEAFFVAELTPGALAGRGGVVRYHPAFYAEDPE